MPIPDRFLENDDNPLPFRDLPAAEAAELLGETRDELCLLDVRTHGEHDTHRIPGSRLIPIQDLLSRIGELDPETPTLVYCEHGIRSVQVASYLISVGFVHVFNLRGGIVAWPGSKEGHAVD